MSTYVVRNLEPRPNPPWVNRILAEGWTTIEQKVPPTFMPIEGTGSGARKRKFEEYGCGRYGCVMPTREPGLVMKLTSDPLEAHFIAAALQIGKFPEGIVAYNRIYRLHAEHQGRPVFVVWREEATDVGELHRVTAASKEEYEKRTLRQFGRRLDRFKRYAHEFKVIFDRAADRKKNLADLRRLERWANDYVDYEQVEPESAFTEPSMFKQQKGAYRMAALLRACEIVAEQMANEPGGYEVGAALEFYMEHGLLLADVHAGNVGRAIREDHTSGLWVITDPGHAVPLDDRYETVSVDILD